MAAIVDDVDRWVVEQISRRTCAVGDVE